MRILFLGINYWPDATGIAPFTTRRCEYLASRGHEVAIYTTFPFYPEWRVRREYRGRIFARELHNGVEILRSAIYVPRKVTSTRRILHEASYVASSLARALGARKPDLLFAVSPPLAVGASAFLLSRLKAVPYVFHVEDLQPDAAMDLKMLRSPLLSRPLYALERFAYRHAALVSTLTEGMRRRIVAKGVPESKVQVSPHWADPALFEVPIAGGGERFRRAFGLEDKFLVLHAGNMGVKQGLEVVLGAADRSRARPDISYLLVGDGVMREALEERAKALALPNLRFLPLQPGAVFLDMLAAADVCLVTQQRSVTDIVFPSKVETLLSAGRPVVASLNSSSEVARVLAQSGAGEVVAAEDPDALLGAIRTLQGESGRRRTMAERGRAYARQRWDRESILPAMEATLAWVGGKTPAPLAPLAAEPPAVP